MKVSCEDGSVLSVRYFTDDTRILVNDTIKLHQVKAASGVRYVGSEHELWEKAGNLLWSARGASPLKCRFTSIVSSPNMVGLANPASVHCVDVGGHTMIETLPNGSDLGICVFSDNRQCGEWALFRGTCQVGGIRVAGYVTEAQRYCAITGGQVGGKDNLEICTTSTGIVCDMVAYFAGTCPPSRADGTQ
jgi:putative hemolysin